MKQTKMFVTVGSTYPLDRLISAADTLAEDTQYNAFAQIGASTLVPKNLKYAQFLEYEEGQKRMQWADIVISHAGVGTIIECLTQHKKIILFPRLEKYGEAIDDHQLEICKAFKERYGIPYATNEQELRKALLQKQPRQQKKVPALVRELKKML